MITLYKFGPFMGTPDSSPFVIKTMLLLKLAGLRYQERTGNPFSAPHGLLPYIEDEGPRIADSGLIRHHLERKYRIDFDGELGPRARALAWSAERLCEDHLYFALLRARWLDPAAFARGLGRHMFNGVPLPLRGAVKVLLKRMNAKRLHGQGLGRLPQEEIEEQAARDFAALSALLGEQTWLLGDAPCGADATVYGMLTAILTPPLEMPLRALGRRHANLVAYCERITAACFPELAAGERSTPPLAQPIPAPL